MCFIHVKKTRDMPPFTIFLIIESLFTHPVVKKDNQTIRYDYEDGFGNIC